MSNNEVFGFLRADGQKIVNGRGDEVLLKGVGLGNWMLPEGYMWKFVNGYDRPRRIEQAITELLGDEQAAVFWNKFHERYTTKSDIKQIASEGYNSIRLPINSRFILKDGTDNEYIEEHLRIIDRFIDWCREYSLYVFLDLHGAPGGQTGANIDDSENNHPDLFRFRENWQRTADLWQMLADRYKDEWIVGGYDLLNEPLPVEFKEYYDQLVPLYKYITNAIRKVDGKHMVILEGAHWATDWTMFTEKFDDNMVLQFHKYWSSPDTQSIERYLAKRVELNVPIWMGESGENGLGWFVGNFQLLEDHNISWNFWPWKKLDTNNSPCSINKPRSWDKIIAYLGGGDKPDMETAKAVFDEYLDNILFENCTYHPEVVNSMMRRLPVRIPAEFYGYRGEGVSFKGGTKKVDSMEFRTKDDIEVSFTSESPDNELVFRNYQAEPENENYNLCIVLHEGEWVEYEFSSAKDSECNIAIRVAADTDASIIFEIDSMPAGSASIKHPEWTEIPAVERIAVKQGRHKIRVRAKTSDVKLDWIELSLDG